MNFFNFLKKKKTQTWSHNCVGNSIRDAWTYEQQTGRIARIEITKINDSTDHAQAMGITEDGDVWVYLTTHNSDGILRIWTKHFPSAEHKRYVKLDDFIDEQREYRHPSR